MLKFSARALALVILSVGLAPHHSYAGNEHSVEKKENEGKKVGREKSRQKDPLPAVLVNFDNAALQSNKVEFSLFPELPEELQQRILMMLGIEKNPAIFVCRYWNK